MLIDFNENRFDWHKTIYLQNPNLRDFVDITCVILLNPNLMQCYINLNDKLNYERSLQIISDGQGMRLRNCKWLYVRVFK